MSLARPRSLSVSEMSDLPPILYPPSTTTPTSDTTNTHLQPPTKPPSRPHTSASTKRPIQTTRAFVVIGATTSSMAILSPPPTPRPSHRSSPPSLNSTTTNPTTTPSPNSPQPPHHQLRRRKSSSTLDHLLRGTKTIEEHRRVVELEIIKRNRAREREKDSGLSSLLGRLKRAVLSDEWDGAQVVYLTAKEAAEREWEIRSKVRSRAGVGLIQRF